MKPHPFAILLTLCVAGCQPRTRTQPATTASTGQDAAAIPSGTYTSCARGQSSASGSSFLNIAGFETGATLTVSQAGGAVTTRYADPNGPSHSLTFTRVTATSSTLAEPVQLDA